MAVRFPGLLYANESQPNIVTFVDYSSTGDLIIEFMPRGSLASQLDQWQPCALRSSYSQAVVRQCLHAIDYLNTRHDMIHHDIKPQNILIQSVEPLRIKLCDFGGADDIVSVHASQLAMGTPGYMSPDFATARHSFGVDVYALGVVLLNLSGYWPWVPCLEDDVARLPSYAHLPCSGLLTNMLAPDPAKRSVPRDCLQHPWLRFAVTRKRSRTPDDDESGEPPRKRFKSSHTFLPDSHNGAFTTPRHIWRPVLHRRWAGPSQFAALFTSLRRTLILY